MSRPGSLVRRAGSSVGWAGRTSCMLTRDPGPRSSDGRLSPAPFMPVGRGAGAGAGVRVIISRLGDSQRSPRGIAAAVTPPPLQSAVITSATINHSSVIKPVRCPWCREDSAFLSDLGPSTWRLINQVLINCSSVRVQNSRERYNRTY